MECSHNLHLSKDNIVIKRIIYNLLKIELVLLSIVASYEPKAIWYL
jgi:hypothetical protein